MKTAICYNNAKNKKRFINIKKYVVVIFFSDLNIVFIEFKNGSLEQMPRGELQMNASSFG